MKNKFQFTNTQKLLIFSVVLVLIRLIKFQDIQILHLIWNLYLAYIPLLILNQLHVFNSRTWSKIIIFTGIIMLPNSIYIFFYLIYLKVENEIPIWFNSLTYFCFSILGLIYFTKSLTIIIKNIQLKFLQQKYTKFFQIFIIFISSISVFIQFKLKIRSWNLISKPIESYNKIYSSSTFDNLLDTLKIALFLVFLYTFYFH